MIDSSIRVVCVTLPQAVDNIAALPLQDHYVIALVYNSPNAAPAASFDWSSGVLHPEGTNPS